MESIFEREQDQEQEIISEQDVRETLEQFFYDAEDYWLQDWWNQRSQFLGYDSDHIYDMEELDDVLYGDSPSEILAMADGGSFSTCDMYFVQDDYGDLHSADDIYDLCFDVDALVDYVLDTLDDFGNSDIADIIKPMTALE